MIIVCMSIKWTASWWAYNFDVGAENAMMLQLALLWWSTMKMSQDWAFLPGTPWYCNMLHVAVWDGARPPTVLENTCCYKTYLKRFEAAQAWLDACMSACAGTLAYKTCLGPNAMRQASKAELNSAATHKPLGSLVHDNSLCVVYTVVKKCGQLLLALSCKHCPFVVLHTWNNGMQWWIWMMFWWFMKQ